MFMTPEQQKSYMKGVRFAAFLKVLCVALSAIALWQGFVVLSFWLLILGVLG